MSRQRAATPAKLVATLSPLLLLVALIGRLPNLGADATGCSRIENSRPAAGANCAPASAQACYYCESSHTGGDYEICAENPDGTIKICQTVEQLPGQHPVNQSH